MTLAFIEQCYSEAEKRSTALVDRARVRDLYPTKLTTGGGEYDMLAQSASAAGGTAGLGRQTSVLQHLEQYRHFIGPSYSAIRPIAQRIASQPIRIARIVNTVEEIDPDGEDSRGHRVKEARRRLLAQKHTVPTSIWHKTFHQDLEVLDGHPILKTIDRPNEIMVRWMLMYVTVASLEITGKAYWWIQRKKKSRAFSYPGSDFTIFPVPTHWVEPQHTIDQLYANYRIRPEGMVDVMTVPGDEIVYIYYPDPANPLSAISPLQAQARAIVADESIAESQRRAFANGIWPGIAVTIGRHPDAAGVQGQRPHLDKEQRAQIMTAIKQAYRGVVHADEPIILDGLIEKVEKLTNTPNEMHFIESGKYTEKRVFQGYGTNPIVVGEIEGANRAQAAVAEMAFCSATVNPKIELLSECLTTWVLPKLTDEPDLLMYIEKAEAHDPEMMLNVEKAGFAAGSLSVNEWRQRHGLPPIHGGDIAYVSGQMQPVHVVRADDDEPDGPAYPPGEDEDDQARKKPPAPPAPPPVPPANQDGKPKPGEEEGDAGDDAGKGFQDADQWADWFEASLAP